MPPVVPKPNTDRFTTIAPPRYGYEGYRSLSTPALVSDSSSRAVMDEARDPSNEYYRRRFSNSDGNSSKGSSSKNQRSVELLPGLEADDIVPGITETSVWKNVLEHMLVAKTGNEEELEEASVALKRTARPLKQQQMYHRRMPSHDIQYKDDATFPALEVAPKINSIKIAPSAYAGQSVGYEPRMAYNPTQQRDPDEIVADDEPMPRGRRNAESDDSLWGFLTCRATDAL